MVTAMILAGGTGTRVGLGRPKQFIEVWGKPVLSYTLDIFQTHSEVDAVEVVCHAGWMDYLKEMVGRYGHSKVKWITEGGDTFQESVMNGMNHLKGRIALDDMVMIHYGAAPFTGEEIITDGIKVCREHGMSASCTPCYQLMGTNDEGEISREWVDRDRFIQIACPQTFRYRYLLDIYEEAKRYGLLDKTEPHTTSLMYALGQPVWKSYGNQTNIKITTAEDIELFKGYVLLKEKERQTWIKES